MSWNCVKAVSQALSTSFSEVHSVEDTWAKYKSLLNSAAREVLEPQLSAKKPWVSQATLCVIDQQRKAIQRGDTEEYRRLAGPRQRSFRHVKNQWVEWVACAGENHLLYVDIKDAFGNFRQLRQKCVTLSAPLKSANGKLQQGICCGKVARVLQHFVKPVFTTSPRCLAFRSQSIHIRSSHWLLPTHNHGNIQSHEQDESGQGTRTMWHLSRIHPAWWKTCTHALHKITVRI